ncbi:MAG: hypothetical protein P9M06_01500 [Candidatus Saelkia tenebricola]|nr:hypothetical protein [Candidatus Saelkia tenebricola]
MIKKSDLYAYLIIIAIACSLYGEVLGFDFAGDDWSIIAQRESFLSDLGNIKTLFLHPGNIKESFNKYSYASGEISYRPLKTLTFFFDYKFWGLNPAGFKLTNLLFHILNTFLIYRFCLFLLSQRLVSLVASLVFLMHPVNVETVVIATYRHDLMALFFYLTAFFVFISALKSKRKIFFIKSMVCCVLYVLAILSKESALTFLILIALYVYLAFKSKTIRADKKEILFLMLGLVFITVLFGFLRFYCNPPEAVNQRVLDAGFYGEILTVVKTFAQYIEWLLMPSGIKFYLIEQFTPIREVGVEVIFNCVTVILLLFLAIRGILKGSFELKLANSWILINLAPLCAIRYLPSLIAARYLYIPSVGFAILLGMLLKQVILNGKAYKAVVVLVVVTLGFYFIKSSYEVKYWENNLMLWTKMKKDFPQNDYVQMQYHINYGGVLLFMGRPKMALEEYLKAHFIDSSNTVALQGMADSLIAIGEEQEAEKNHDIILGIEK